MPLALPGSRLNYAVGVCQSATAIAPPTAAAIVHQKAVRSAGAFSRNRLRRVGHDTGFFPMRRQSMGAKAEANQMGSGRPLAKRRATSASISSACST